MYAYVDVPGRRPKVPDIAIAMAAAAIAATGGRFFSGAPPADWAWGWLVSETLVTARMFKMPCGGRKALRILSDLVV